MSHRNRSKSILSFTARLLKAAEEARAKADKLEPGQGKKYLLEKAREFEAQVSMNTFLNTPGA